ncbi:MAG: GNAT family N-acetyltransferase [Carnobacterium sp.]|uniref:GNAT family N-acetyltransferase n=1 Tax=Carnobacterium sp. TaxID=48221 RepID=UPI0033152C53
MEFIWTTDLNSNNYKDAIKIRKKVFVEEQLVPPELEIDDLEDQTIHVIGYLENKAVSTARIYKKNTTTFKIQRVAVLMDFRKKNLGYELMMEIERYAKTKEFKTLMLDAQDHALTFYEKLGYQVEGEGFMDAGIPHHLMIKNLD